jgi:hypothetical protein
MTRHLSCCVEQRSSPRRIHLPQEQAPLGPRLREGPVVRADAPGRRDWRRAPSLCRLPAAPCRGCHAACRRAAHHSRRVARRPAAPCRGQRREESRARATRRLPLAEDENVRGAARVCPPASKDVRDGRRRGGSDGC